MSALRFDVLRLAGSDLLLVAGKIERMGFFIIRTCVLSGVDHHSFAHEHGSMIEIKPSKTADTRTCDFANTTKETLLESSRQHIGDVVKALAFFGSKITEAAGEHDYDKLTAIDWFHADFVTGFNETGWWDNHRKIHRHHLANADGVPADVNFLDVLEYIADCVMAGMARSGSIYELKLSEEILQRAFQNTVELLKSQVVVVTDASDEKVCAL